MDAVEQEDPDGLAQAARGGIPKLLRFIIPYLPAWMHRHIHQIIDTAPPPAVLPPPLTRDPAAKGALFEGEEGEDGASSVGSGDSTSSDGGSDESSWGDLHQN